MIPPAAGPLDVQARSGPPFVCRAGCGACCIAPSLARPYANAPFGKPAGVRCVNLADDLTCRIWGGPDYPRPCAGFQPEPAVCGVDRDDALARLAALEAATAP